MMPMPPITPWYIRWFVLPFVKTRTLISNEGTLVYKNWKGHTYILDFTHHESTTNAKT